MDCDVAVVGGGPGGSTLGTYLKLHDPRLKVVVFERENFPRDHVGESQLPIISYYLDEMGVWDKVESAGFPIKIGATYKWGVKEELWDFDFIVNSKFQEELRPARFVGQRRKTAFQVDRAIYDKILLDHAKGLGCEVYEGTSVAKVSRNGDRITQLELPTGESVHAKYYIDATGHSGLIRRAMGIEVEHPTGLQNVAIWDYWQNAEWAENIGIGGTRVQVMSVGYGWIWFIPLGPTRTSVGLIMPVEYYKSSGKRPEELYLTALGTEPRISELTRKATRENKLATTKDWSFLAKRMYGENWFLVGESSGFADPILAAGLSITQAAAREAAFTILELERGRLEPDWLKAEYEKLQVNRVTNHIRFADYWYAANAQFTDLKEFTKSIAKSNGLDLSPDKAWQWLGQGGFIDDELGTGSSQFSLAALRALTTYLSPARIDRPLGQNNVFRLDLDGATREVRARYGGGKVERYVSFRRDGKILPLDGVFLFLFEILEKNSQLSDIMAALNKAAVSRQHDVDFQSFIIGKVVVALEAMIEAGWVVPSLDPSKPVMPIVGSFDAVHPHEEQRERLQKIAAERD